MKLGTIAVQVSPACLDNADRLHSVNRSMRAGGVALGGVVSFHKTKSSTYLATNGLRLSNAGILFAIVVLFAHSVINLVG